MVTWELEGAEPVRVVQIVGRIDGQRTAWDGKWVVEYDPTRRGHGPQGTHLITTDDPAQATRYASLAAAHVMWTQVGRPPTRPDGKPNRPLTGFSINTEPLDKAGELTALFAQVQEAVRRETGGAVADN